MGLYRWIWDKKTGKEGWKYYGIVTNWNLFKNKLQTVVEFHNQRSNAERKNATKCLCLMKKWA